MTTLSKTFLTIAIVGLTAGTIVAACGDNVSPTLTVVLPFGAIAFGLFLIAFILEKEVAIYDQEQAAKFASQGNTAPAPDKKEIDAHPKTLQRKEQTV